MRDTNNLSLYVYNDIITKKLNQCSEDHDNRLEGKNTV